VGVGGGGGGGEEARVGRDRARAASALSCPACNFPAIFPANLPLLVGDGRTAPSFPVSLALSPFHASGRIVYRTGPDQGPEPRSRISDRREKCRHRCVARPEEFIGVLSPSLFDFLPTRHQVQYNKCDKCSAHSQITRLVLIACFSKMVIKFEINLLIRRQHVCEV